MAIKARVPGNVERRGSGFRVQLCVDGVRHRETIQTSDRRIAEAFARKRYAELHAAAMRRKAGLDVDKRMSDLFTLFERDHLPTLAKGAADAYGDSLKALKQYFGDELADPFVAAVRAKEIAGYLSWRRVHRLGGGSDALSNRSLAKDRAVLHKMFVIADRLEWREGNPVARVAAPKAAAHDPIILDPDQFESLLTNCKTSTMRLYVLLLGETGMRCDSEALWLRWEDLTLADAAFLHIVSGRDGRKTKSGKGRGVPLSPRLATALREHVLRYKAAQYRGGSSPWVLHHTHGGPRYRAGDRISDLHAGFKAAAQRAKLPTELRQHDLRHTRITWWLAAGKSPVQVQHAVGHADLRTTMGYYRFVRDHLLPLVTDVGTAPIAQGATSAADVPTGVPTRKKGGPARTA